ncbi:MAG: hypothetical protein UX91_C0003G0014 [Candidatus Amesbacteria bacterium GW2011_GWB1_47_19]|nr:MAG: hypothetical protein UW51_C0003G0020 [Candidatus Amesbacteria bacterium GW2011_GWA1_44_24]KKU31445.1 MAG: hypothetical protein UX46_C0005G0014 [Candidatus Amesbacteria bacterium GW2011_GWC1_46_24]KKU67453.1 MAG: hypothetical protein UX91_C0003G0014 [Candidatus Amesbacteria bacterium GW2011_GWB1_47_19]
MTGSIGFCKKSGDKTGVTEGEEAVFFSNGCLVCSTDNRPGSHGGNKHDQTGTGQVEVGDHAVDKLETVRRADKDVRVTGAGVEPTRFV